MRLAIIREAFRERFASRGAWAFQYRPLAVYTGGGGTFYVERQRSPTLRADAPDVFCVARVRGPGLVHGRCPAWDMEWIARDGGRGYSFEALDHGSAATARKAARTWAREKQTLPSCDSALKGERK